jgi:hypothetical protein
MSATPPSAPPPEPPRAGYGYMPGHVAGARLPIPGNAEFALYLLIVVVLIILWVASDSIDTGTFTVYLVALTIGYFISRGIAKASRVLEQ